MAAVMRSCPLCASPGATPIANGRDYLLGGDPSRFTAVACQRCGFAFLEHVPDDLARYYPRRYFTLSQTASTCFSRAAELLMAREARWLARRVPSRRSVLEIGPGNGRFLNALAGAYPEVRLAGFDVSSGARLEERVEAGVELRFAPSLVEAGFEAGRFDLVVMRHVLEHVPDLGSLLAELERIGKPDLVLYVKVPNRASWVARAFGPYWNGYDFPRHLAYFRPADLARLFNAAGFSDLEIGYEADSVDWAGSLRFWFAGRGFVKTNGALAVKLLMAARLLVLPVSLLARSCRRSSRLWALLRRAAY